MGYTLVTDTIVDQQSKQPYGISLDFQTPSLFQSIVSYNNEKQALNNLKNLLLTKIGEKYGNPTFGSDLLYILFQPNINDIKNSIKTLITDPVSYWLPIITILDIVINTAQDNPDLQHEIEIKIIFQVNSRSAQQLNINLESNGTITTTSDTVI